MSQSVMSCVYRRHRCKAKPDMNRSVFGQGKITHADHEMGMSYGLKRFLNVSVKTPNIMIYGDTGTYPLSVNTTMLVVKYWIKKRDTEEDGLLMEIYRVLIQTIDSTYS